MEDKKEPKVKAKAGTVRVGDVVDTFFVSGSVTAVRPCKSFNERVRLFVDGGVLTLHRDAVVDIERPEITPYQGTRTFNDDKPGDGMRRIKYEIRTSQKPNDRFYEYAKNFSAALYAFLRRSDHDRSRRADINIYDEAADHMANYKWHPPREGYLEFTSESGPYETEEEDSYYS